MTGPRWRVLATIAALGIAAIAVAALFTTRREQAVASCAAAPEQIQRTSHQYADRPGTDSERTTLDVYAAPGARDCPVLVWVHGGSWQAGGRRTRSTAVKAEHFVAQGWTFVSINYRLASEDNDVRWPAFGDDTAAAVAWIVDNPNDIGVDSAHVAVMGHSAGAHLVSILGTHPTLLAAAGAARSDVACVISLDSVTHDLTDAPAWEVDIIELAFPTDAEKIDGSPTLQAPSLAETEAPSFLIVTRGRPARIDSSHRLADALHMAGAAAVVADVSPYDHGEVSTQLGIEGEAMVTPLVDNFLSGCTN